MPMIQLPFQGFYHTTHSWQIDNEFDRVSTDWEDIMGCDMPQSLADLFFIAADFAAAYAEYAQDYVQAFCEEFFDSDGTFDGMESPREYNFETDRVFAQISDETLKKIWDETSAERLRKVAARRHTSYDGFSSFYSSDTSTWGPYQEWDHNQLMTLLLAWLPEDFDEMCLVEDFECQTLWNKPEANRPWKIWNYLTYERKNR